MHSLPKAWHASTLGLPLVIDANIDYCSIFIAVKYVIRFLVRRS